jgi:hypothetical protein
MASMIQTCLTHDHDAKNNTKLMLLHNRKPNGGNLSYAGLGDLVRMAVFTGWPWFIYN